jgi:hypothetical protein
MPWRGGGVSGRVERWLFGPGSPQRLASVRIGLCTVLAARLALGHYTELAGQPAALFRPRSFMQLFSSMPARPLTIAVQVLGVVMAGLAALGCRARLTLPVAWGAGVLLTGMVNSLGKVVHNDVLLLLCLVPLLIAPTSDAWSVDARRARAAPTAGAAYGWPVRSAALVVVGAYFFVGLAKVLHSGPAWVTSDNLRWVLYASSDAHADPNRLALFIADRPVLAHAVAAMTLLLELSFPALLLRPRLTPLYAAGAVGLHTGIYLAMGLDYSAQAATAVIVLIDWPTALSRARGALPRNVTAILRARAVGWKT